MKHFFLRKTSILLLLLTSVAMNAQTVRFDQYFTDETLRVGYTFTGNDKEQHVALDELCRIKGWAGRRANLDSLPWRANGIITMRDAKTHKVIYRTHFSSLFQEWQTTEEATRVDKSFENVFQLPMPKDSVELCVELFDTYAKTVASLAHIVQPTDILIRTLAPRTLPPHRYLHKSHRSDAIDVVIVAEGYQKKEAKDFYAYAKQAMNALFAHEPFGTLRDRFNILAVALPSADSGVSVPGASNWKQTALSSHFNTFYSDRYLTTLRLRQLHDALAGLPYEHIIILANTDTYGGGGILNSYTLTTTRNPQFEPVVVHEFGHSFAGLGDEYYYDDQFVPYYNAETEPWEQNISTLKDFPSKWSDMLPQDISIPTPPDAEHPDLIGVYEGGGYMSKGVFRAYQDCRMKTNTAKAFCPVCQRALSRLIHFYAP